MDSLRISLLSLPEEGVEVVAGIPLADLCPQCAEPLPGDVVALHGWLTPLDETYLFRGEARGEFVHACDRCLAEAHSAYVIEICWTFEEGPALHPFEGASGTLEDHDDAVEDLASVQRYQGGEIDLAPPLWEELQFALPEKYLCRGDCRGLCPQCGSNLNEGDCGCPSSVAGSEQINPGLAGLADLLPGLPREEPKE